jgi:hypothetical protein
VDDSPFYYEMKGQREKMLTALVHIPPHFVSTPYFLKLDTDCVAMGPGKWIEPWWFENDPVFVTSPWGYTKPANAIQILDDWGDTIEGLRDRPRLNIPFDPSAGMVRHRRIISYVFFCRTNWARETSDVICNSSTGGRLPVPSQDTMHWYIAARRGDFFRTVNMKRYGWAHLSGLDKIRHAAEEAQQRKH